MIINPDWGMSKKQMEKRIQILSNYVSAKTQLSMKCLTKTKVYLDSIADSVMAGPEIVEMTVHAQEEGYDAVILYCFSDPVLEACRQVVDIPVIGAGQAACLMAPIVGYQAAVILSDKKRIPEKKIMLSRTGINTDRIIGFDAIRKKGLDPIEDRIQLEKELLKAGHRILKKTDAQVLVLGCLSFLGFGEKLEKELHVPVIDPGTASVALAEATVRLRYHSSKKSYLNRKDMTYVF